ncbi:class I SAM-dependent methyltransferase [Thermodesulfobacteriota bacterium]
MESKNCTLQDFYDNAATAPPEFRFLSPTVLETWSMETAQWLCTGKNICEIGSGNGSLALRTMETCVTPLHYLLVDISQTMLDVAKNSLSKKNNSLIEFQYIRADIEKRLPYELCRNKADRLIAVNVLQDVNINSALKNIRKMLNPDGEFQATFISKESQDVFWKDNPGYDRSNGLWCAGSQYHQNKKCEPLGYCNVDGRKKPFYRLLHCYTREVIHYSFNLAGFEVLSIEPIIYPVEYVLKRWSSKYHFMKLNKNQIKLLKEENGYSDGWSVKAKVSESVSP